MTLVVQRLHQCQAEPDFADRGRLLGCAAQKQYWKARRVLDQQEFLNKLAQIEEQANATLGELPNTHLVKERMRMVRALARYMRAAIADGGIVGRHYEIVSRPSDNDDRKQGSG